MGKVAFDKGNKSQSFSEYPKLSLDKGERARIVVLEDPTMEWVHALRKPTLVDGAPVYDTRTGKGGATSQELRTDFVGQHICLGDAEVLQDKGVDVVNCPTCKASQESDAIEGPKRRFAMHVLRYRTQPGSFTVQDPFQVEILAWVFADNRFNTLVDLQEEWGDLRKHDLMLGPCEVKQYQKYDIQVAAKAEWLANDERKKIVKSAYANNTIKGDAGLQPLIGRKQDILAIQSDIQTVFAANDAAFGGGLKDAAAAAGEKEAFEQEVADLLGDSLETVSSTDTAAADEGIVGEGEDFASATDDDAAPAPMGGTESLDDLLSGL